MQKHGSFREESAHFQNPHSLKTALFGVPLRSTFGTPLTCSKMAPFREESAHFQNATGTGFTPKTGKCVQMWTPQTCSKMAPSREESAHFQNLTGTGFTPGFDTLFSGYAPVLSLWESVLPGGGIAIVGKIPRFGHPPQNTPQEPSWTPRIGHLQIPPF